MENESMGIASYICIAGGATMLSIGLVISIQAWKIEIVDTYNRIIAFFTKA